MIRKDSYEGAALYLLQAEKQAGTVLHVTFSSVFKAGEEYSFSTVVKYDEGPDSQTFYLTLQYDARTMILLRQDSYS